MTGFPLILAHLLFVYALAVEPILGLRMYRSLNRSLPHDPGALARFYRLGIAFEWTWVILIGVILLFSNTSREDIGLVWTRGLASDLLTFGPGFAAGTILALAALSLKSRTSDGPGLRESLEQMLEPVAAFLPSTSRERWLFAGLSITAGICEEILFRGFLIFYLSNVFPGAPAIVAAGLSSLIFGMARLYQGVRGALTTAAFGAILAFTYLSTGSLFISIILHALVDLRILLLYRPASKDLA